MSNDRLEKLDELIKVQTSPGNWDYDPYLHGMANGMILSQAILKDEEPQFLTAPEKWGADIREEAKKEANVKENLES